MATIQPPGSTAESLTTSRSPTTGDGSWSTLLTDEERHVARQHIGAGVMVISFAPELISRVDDDARTLVESAIISIIESNLGWTDRTAALAPGRLGVVIVPVNGALALAARARDMHAALRERGLLVDVAYALRLDRGGLAAAAARADAAL
ncbi:MAG: hypothetical protein ACE5GB_15655, partial [Acidimicrobiales bacterium]